MAEKTYEMLWDCAYCGTRKLLGKTHRHCPNCGAPQDATRRYFPPENEKVAVEDHVYVGADVQCSGCGFFNSRSARHCGNCGGPLEAAKEAARLQDQVQPIGAPHQVPAVMPQAVAAPAAAVAKPAKPKSKAPVAGMLIGCGLFVLIGLLVIVGAFAFLWKKDASVEATGHQWTREIEIERHAEVTESEWCDKMPAGAKNIKRTREKRSTRQVQDGEDCSMRKVDQGDGTYKETRECKPRYRDEPVYDDKCRYSIARWVKDRTEKATGGDTTNPQWPEVRLRTGTCLGCERESKRTETYRVRFRNEADGKELTCELDESRWRSIKVGSRFKSRVSVIAGSLDCDSLQAQ